MQNNRQPSQVFDVRWGDVPAQLHKVEVATRKAQRAGLEGYTAEVVGTYTTAERTEPGKPAIVRHRAIVHVYGEVPRVPGWQFAGTVQWDAHAGAMVNRVPGLDEAVALPTPTERRCDHCGTVRHRNDTFLVLADSGELRQVGRNCLTAYTGIPVGWVSTAMAGVEEVEPGYGGAEYDGYYTDELLAITATMVRVYGWQPKSGYGTPTVAYVAQVLEPKVTKWNAEAKAAYEREANEADAATAAAAISWARSLPDNDDGTYLCNLHRVLSANEVSSRNLGLAVSALQAHAKAQERDLIERQEKAAAQPVPTGDGITVEGIITSLRWKEGYTYNSPATLKARVQGDGWGVWVTVPRAYEDDAATEQRVRFVANVHTDGDEYFGFAKRPRKWEVVA